MMKNVGMIDAGVRVAVGLTAFGLGVAKRKPAVIALGALGTASGLTGYCPVYALAGMNSSNATSVLMCQLEQAVQACTGKHDRTEQACTGKHDPAAQACTGKHDQAEGEPQISAARAYGHADGCAHGRRMRGEGAPEAEY